MTKRTGPTAASMAGRTLRSTTASKPARSAAASALAQRGDSSVTSRAAASKAAKTLASPTASPAAKSAAASALSQRPSKGRR